MVSATPAGETTQVVIPAQRVAAFRTSVAARLREGAPPSLLMREQQALATALSTKSFAEAMTLAYASELDAQEPNPKYRLPMTAAEAQMKGILANRVRDAVQYTQLLSDPNFVATCYAEAQQPAPLAKEFELSPEKKEEIVRRLVQANDPGGNEPAVHVYAAALGQQVVHQTLANIYRPQQGGLRAPLVDALAQAWPEATGAQLEALASDWLKARHDAAHSTADALDANTGELYAEAIRRVTTPQPLQLTQPVQQIAVPAQPQLTLKTSADLVMEI